MKPSSENDRTIQKSKFDINLGKIKELLELGLSVRKIAKFLGYSNHIALNTYVKKRKLREHACMECVIKKDRFLHLD